MTDDALQQVLRLVAEGRLTTQEAGPILDALDVRASADPSSGPGPGPGPGRGRGSASQSPSAEAGSFDDGPARAIRFEIRDAGRQVVNLRVPLALGRTALDNIPGLSASVGDRIRAALSSGLKGPIVHVDDDGDGVRISIE